MTWKVKVDMDKELQIRETDEKKVILIGALVGAITGAGAGFLLSKRLEEEEDFRFTTRDGLKLGGAIFALLRQISKFGS